MNLAFIATGSIYWVHADHLGTPQVLTDGARAVAWDADYRPFGEATVTGALAFNLRFPGQYHDDETGLHYNYFRDYDPTLGRYLESDPIGLAGGWNSYAYVGGNPVMRVDPRGLVADVSAMPENTQSRIGGAIAEAERVLLRCYSDDSYDCPVNKEMIDRIITRMKNAIYRFDAEDKVSCGYVKPQLAIIDKDYSNIIFLTEAPFSSQDYLGCCSGDPKLALPQTIAHEAYHLEGATEPQTDGLSKKCFGC